MAGRILRRKLIAKVGKLLHGEPRKRDEIHIIGAADHLTDLLDQKKLFVSHSLDLTSSLTLILTPGVIVAEIVQERM